MAVKKQFVRQQYSVQFKRDVIKSFVEGRDINTTMDRYFADIADPKRKHMQKLVYKWTKKSSELAGRSASELRQRDLGLGTTLAVNVEQVLVMWINDLRRDGVPVSALMLKLKPLEIAAEAGIPTEDFATSWHWRRGFMKRHRFSFRSRTHQGQVTPADAFRQAALLAEKTCVFFELLPRTTIEPTGSKTVWVKCGKKEKERLTAMILGDSHGNKYPLFLVLKTAPSKVPQTRVENTRDRHGFGRYVWNEVEALQGDHAQLRPREIPTGLTWLCQPADAVWIKTIKDRLRRYWVLYLQDQIAQFQATDGQSAFEMKPPDRADIVEWSVSAWNDVSPATIHAGFRACQLGVDCDDTVVAEEYQTTELQAPVDSLVSQLEELCVDLDTDALIDIDDVVEMALNQLQ